MVNIYKVGSQIVFSREPLIRVFAVLPGAERAFSWPMPSHSSEMTSEVSCPFESSTTYSTHRWRALSLWGFGVFLTSFLSTWIAVEWVVIGMDGGMAWDAVGIYIGK